MYHYLKIAADQATVLEWIFQNSPKEGYNSRADSALDGNPYLVPADEVKPALSAGQRHTGPALEYTPGADTGTVRWGVENIPAVTTIPYADFKARFTAQEMAGVRAAVLQDGEALEWALDAAAAGEVNLLSPNLSAFLDKMVAAQILTPERAEEVGAP